MKEEWRAAVGFEGRYEVSDHGRVRGVGTRSRGIRKPYRTAAGHSQVCLYIRPKTTVNVLVHKLVADAFLGPLPVGMCRCHNDGDGTNNHVSNLRFDTPKGNSQDMVRHGRSQFGSRQRNARLTDDLVVEIRRVRSATGKHLRALAAQFGVSYSTIQKVLSGEGWKHV